MSRHPLDLSEHLPYLINRVGSALVARFSTDGLAGARLSIAAWRVLAALSSNAGLRQTDLAELTSIDASTLSRLITRLERDGLVRRTRSKQDSREVAVALTAKAATAMTRLVPIAAGLQKKATRNLSKQDLATLKRVLRKMHDNLTRGEFESPGTQGLSYLSPPAGREPALGPRPEGRRAKRGR